MRYFKTDGIRGRVNESFKVETAFKLGKALKCLNVKRILLGIDTRSSSYMYASAVCAGALSVSIDVFFLGIVTTPMVIYYSKIKNLVGVIITASHNPYYDNGIKVVNNGLKLDKETLKKIEYNMDNFNYKINDFGQVIKFKNVSKNYIKDLGDLSVILKYKYAIDCANGSGYLITRKIFKNAHIINGKPNGKNINYLSGSLYPNLAKNYVKKHNLDYGFCFDGDADRVIVVDKYNTYNGDDICYLLARYFKDIKILKNNKVALSVMSNLKVREELIKHKIEYVLCDVGDYNLIKAQQKHDIVLGSEESGHISINCFGDAINTTLYILRALSYYNIPLNKLLTYKKYPQILCNIEYKEKVPDEKLQHIKDKYSKIYDANIVLRKSGTEPIIRLYVCGKSMKICRELIIKIKEEL